ncbi:MAG: citryl-CoA lyase [Methanobrevibacter sp.]|jgi:citrate synthase|nr:citryl-CoA lyase [Candidatus Methanovirga basalitermitum]
METKKKSLEEIFKMREHAMRTAITKIEPDKITTKGYSQEDLIANLTYPEMIFLFFRDELPSKRELKMFNHILVSFCDHGLTPPSTQTVRLITSSGSPLNVALSGALLSFGSNHAGAIEKTMKIFQNAMKNNEDLTDREIDKIAIDITNQHSKMKKNVPGFGHRYHAVDPRARKILELAIEEGFVGIHTKLALAIENDLQEKNIKLNIDGINASILSDLGFKPETGIGLFIIGRLPGLIAHSLEERNNENVFRKLYELEEVPYVGDEDKTF